MKLFSPWYRFRIRVFRYLHARDILQAILLIITLVLAVNTLSVKPTLTIVAGAIYLVALVLLGVDTFFTREARDRMQAEVLWGLFAHMNREIFNDDNRTRFTFFIRAPFRRDHIVPWYRYQRGANDPIAEAQKSRAQYRRGEGLTGRAWSETGELFFSQFPPFATRNEFETYYKDTLEIHAATVSEISGYMEKVRAMFTYGFTDARGKFLGVLSLDLQTALTLESGPDKRIDANAMALILHSMQSVLESFAVVKRY